MASWFVSAILPNLIANAIWGVAAYIAYRRLKTHMATNLAHHHDKVIDEILAALFGEPPDDHTRR